MVYSLVDQYPRILAIKKHLQSYIISSNIKSGKMIEEGRRENERERENNKWTHSTCMTRKKLYRQNPKGKKWLALIGYYVTCYSAKC